MARILVLAPSGFGKTTSAGEIPELGIIGLAPKDTYFISVTSKPLPFRGSATTYPALAIPVGVTVLPNIGTHKRVITNDASLIASAISQLAESPFTNIVVDDFNYIMQDYYMDNALRQGWDAPKKIGFDINKVFKAMEKFEGTTKNIFVLAHGEAVTANDGRIYFKLKTTGKMIT